MIGSFLMTTFGLAFIGHMSHEVTTQTDSSGTSQTSSTVKPDGLWENMYKRDRYARDRVMKSARLLLPYLKDGDTVLDVGCYTHEAKKYFPRTIKYIGVDQKAYHPESRVVDLNHGFSPIPAQHALCLETLEHLIDPQDTLESICSSLPDHGVLVVSVPNEATLFHRLRCLCGTVDAGCFASEGKHLHLPSLAQAEKFLSAKFDVLSRQYYISPSACNSESAWVGRILTLIPDRIHQSLADRIPSLFARGFIFLLCKKGAKPTMVNPHERATFVRPEQIPMKQSQ